MSHKHWKTYVCPHCEEEVRVGTLACPHCGSCDETGWSADASSGLDLPDDSFDYERFVEQTLGQKPKPRKKEVIISAIALILIVVWVLSFVI